MSDDNKRVHGPSQEALEAMARIEQEARDAYAREAAQESERQVTPPPAMTPGGLDHGEFEGRPATVYKIQSHNSGVLETSRRKVTQPNMRNSLNGEAIPTQQVKGPDPQKLYQWEKERAAEKAELERLRAEEKARVEEISNEKLHADLKAKERLLKKQKTDIATLKKDMQEVLSQLNAIREHLQ